MSAEARLAELGITVPEVVPSVNAKIEDYIYSLTYNNWGTTFVGDYSFQITDDDATPTNDRRVQAWGLQASRPFHYKKYDVRFFPRLSYRYSRDRFRLTGARHQGD